MREIIFRGKRLDNGEWVEGFYNHIPNGRFGTDEHLIQTIKENGKIGMLYDVDPSTVGQYTGLVDNNGKQIFEGDILLLDDMKGIVNYGTGCFCVKLPSPNYLYLNNPAIDMVLNEYPGLEIIGNVHDNPELLKEEGKP